MKCSLEWLNTYLDQSIEADEAMRLLDDQGFPIEDELSFDVEVTSNRGDCLSHIGVARELAAGSGRSLKLPDLEVKASAGAPVVGDLTNVANEAPDLCPVYTARVIRGVKVGPSPQWMVDRLEAIGLRSVNNVVDVTNFVLHETGQPLHAFDMDKLAGGRIIVRRAKQGEKFIAIDNTSHELRSDMLVIADEECPVAVAGVMGGLESEVGDDTVNVLLESAEFIPLSVRTTSRRLKLSSDSSYRFERGIDPRGVELASRRAANLILELAGGELADGVVRVGVDEPSPTQITMRIARCRSLLGYEITADRMAELLNALQLDAKADESAGTISCTVPSWRGDLKREVDLIEEIARMNGLDTIEVQDRISIKAQSPGPRAVARQLMGQVLVAHGYHETITFSFLAPKLGKPFIPAGGGALMIGDERRKAEPMLRPSLIPSLLQCRKSNQDVGNEAVKLFEVASTWYRKEGNIVETRRLGVMADAPDAQQAVREIRGVFEHVIGQLAGDVDIAVESIEVPNCQAAASVSAGGKSLGWYGVASAECQKLFDLQTPVIFGEMDSEALLAMYPPKRTVTPLSRFPGIERDLSVIVAEDIAWQQIQQLIESTSPQYMETLNFITTYRGKPIEKGAKSVSFRMTFRNPDATLRHEEVDPQVNAVVEILKREVNAELRA